MLYTMVDTMVVEPINFVVNFFSVAIYVDFALSRFFSAKALLQMRRAG